MKIYPEKLTSKDRIIANSYGAVTVLHYDKTIWSYDRHLPRVIQAMIEYQSSNKAQDLATFSFLNPGFPETRQVYGKILRLPDKALNTPTQEEIKANFTSINFYTDNKHSLRAMTAESFVHQGIALSALNKDFTMPIAIFANLALESGLENITVSHLDDQLNLSLMASKKS